MPLTPIQHRRAHNLVLIKKLLDCRDGASPLTLVVDSLKQSAQPLLRDIIRRARKSRTQVVFVAWDTLRKPDGADIFLPAGAWDLSRLSSELHAHLKPTKQRTIVLFDALNTLLQPSSSHPLLANFLSSLITPTVSVIAVYHTDVPIPHDATSYAPKPLTLLRYLATSILSLHCMSHILAARHARQRSLAEPVFGLAEERAGLIIGKGSNDPRGVVIEMEYRRKSGRAIHEVFFLPRRKPVVAASSQGVGVALDDVLLLDDHPLYKAAGETTHAHASEADDARVDDSTFSLDLTDKQRRDRGGVVLPYFDAQADGGVGEGGRILYEMGTEDDFDEEEDEI